MSDGSRGPGWDSKVISEIANGYFDGYGRMFEYHGWSERGSNMMPTVQRRVTDTYGTVDKFQSYFKKDFWTGTTRILLMHLLDWTPETWGAIGFSGIRGPGRRRNLLSRLPDPFICVCYVGSGIDDNPEHRGMLCGFYLVTHRVGDRKEFMHPSIHQQIQPSSRWQHSLQAIRAFSYQPEYRLKAMDVLPSHVRSGVGTNCQEISDRRKINRLLKIRWEEVPVYSRTVNTSEFFGPDHFSDGMVRAGPASGSGYVVSQGTQELHRELYVLRMSGDIDTYLGYPSGDASIYKIGLSKSPDLRRQSLQKSMPEGVYKWEVARSTRKDDDNPYSGHEAAVAGENAMKVHLAKHAEWLGGEFYLASDKAIEVAWRAGRKAARRADRSPG